MELGPVGIWSVQFRTEDRAKAKEAVAELDELGFGALWVPDSGTNLILDVAADLLASSKRMVIASGILNIWLHEPDEVAAAVEGFDATYPGRFLLGLGASHAHLVEAATARRYQQPLSEMVKFLDALDITNPPIAQPDRMLAALGPRMIELARDRTAGAHPYCVPVAHTAFARETLGNGPILAPELKVVLSFDADVARGVARGHLDHYLVLPNYANNLLRFGYTEADLADGGSDRLVDDLVAWGSVENVVDRIAAHHAAGADHVCIQVLTADTGRFPIQEWREIAGAINA